MPRNGGTWWNPFPGWPSEASVAGSVPLVAKTDWTSSWAQKRVKKSRNRWAKPEGIIHSNGLTFLMKASLLEVQHKLLVKYITSATATPIPVPHGPDSDKHQCLHFQVPETLPLRVLLRRVNGDFQNSNHIRFFMCWVNLNIQWTNLSHSQLINKLELVTPTSRTITWLNETVYMNTFLLLKTT